MERNRVRYLADAFDTDGSRFHFNRTLTEFGLDKICNVRCELVYGGVIKYCCLRQTETDLLRYPVYYLNRGDRIHTSIHEWHIV